MFKAVINEAVAHRTERLSHADLSADRNRNVIDRHAVEILRCCLFDLQEERNGDRLINPD